MLCWSQNFEIQNSVPLSTNHVSHKQSSPLWSRTHGPLSPRHPEWSLRPKGVRCAQHGWVGKAQLSMDVEPRVACLCEAGIQSSPSEGPGEHPAL